MLDFDPRDRDEDVRDVEMPRVDGRDYLDRDRDQDDFRDRGEDLAAFKPE